MATIQPAGFEATLEAEVAQRPVETARIRRNRSLLVWLSSNPRASVGVGLLLVFGIAALIGPWVAPYDPTAITAAMNNTPSWSHWLGTTTTGQDIFSQLLAGARPTIFFSLLAGLIATVISCLFGMGAGYARGVVDDVLSLLTNVVLILPTLPLLIVVAAYAADLNYTGAWVETVVIAVTAWPWGARVLRSQMLSLRQRDFVLAARVAGESGFRTIWDEILPNMISLVVANFIGATLYALLFGTALQFLGLADANQVTWGTILQQAETGDALNLGLWAWFVPVGLCIALFGTGLAFTNYAIDELTNPRLRSQKARKAKRGSRHSAPGSPSLAPTIRGDDVSLA